jgi:hypothetical protein
VNPAMGRFLCLRVSMEHALVALVLTLTENILYSFSLWYDIAIIAESQTSIGNLSRTISAEEKKKRLLYEMWFRTVGNDEMIPAVIATERNKLQKGTLDIPRLPALKKFRAQAAGLAVGKVYAFLGMTANEYQIKPDYSKSTYEVYAKITNLHLMKNILLVLL